PDQDGDDFDRRPAEERKAGRENDSAGARRIAVRAAREGKEQAGKACEGRDGKRLQTGGAAGGGNGHRPELARFRLTIWHPPAQEMQSVRKPLEDLLEPAGNGYVTRRIQNLSGPAPAC